MSTAQVKMLKKMKRLDPTDPIFENFFLFPWLFNLTFSSSIKGGFPPEYLTYRPLSDRLCQPMFISALNCPDAVSVIGPSSGPRTPERDPAPKRLYNI